MKFLPPSVIRGFDERALRENIAGSATLMGRAARGLARSLLDQARACGWSEPTAWLVAGKGNNGGDTSRLAALLHAAGWRVRLWLAARATDLQGDARAAWNHAVAAGVPAAEKPAPADWALDGDTLPLVDVVVDGLLGSGSTGAPRDTAAAAIRAIQACGREALVVAVDIPSGLDAETGVAHEPRVRADLTLTLTAPKSGFAKASAWECTGSIEHLPLEFPPEWIAEAEKSVPEPLRAITRAGVRAHLPRRSRQAHKGVYGRVLLIGGSRGLTGAIGLAARAAVRAGAGLVTVITPASQAATAAALCPEAMVHPGPETTDGTLSSDLWQEWNKKVDSFDAILVGPGMGTGQDTMQIIRKLFTGASAPMVLDADGINIFEGRAHWMEKSAGPVVVTPHPGELARLLGLDVAAVQADRQKAVRQAAAATGATVVLKGAGTLVSQATGDTWVNLNGNPGMASGGTGDVLAGLLAGLLAQGLAPIAAATTAVYAHGRAGDLAAWKGGQAGLCASDLIEALPQVLRIIQER